MSKAIGLIVVALMLCSCSDQEGVRPIPFSAELLAESLSKSLGANFADFGGNGEVGSYQRAAHWLLFEGEFDRELMWTSLEKYFTNNMKFQVEDVNSEQKVFRKDGTLYARSFVLHSAHSGEVFINAVVVPYGDGSVVLHLFLIHT